MKRLGLALGLAFASAATAAQAQSIISRQITTEPVETVVTQGPDGTIVTRRPLGPAPVTTVPTTVYTPPAVVAPTAPAVVETVETVDQPATVTREVVRPRTITRASARTRVQTTAWPASRRVRVTRRVVTAPAPRAAALTPQERQTVYRTIIRERVAPPVVVTPPVTSYAPLTSISTAPVVEAVDSYVGTALPSDVVLYDVPQSVAFRVPAARGYRYAYVDDRVLLVDPITRVVVEDVTE